ncbi:putative RNA-directed DNA polymerase from transposon BS [Trichonephila clavata]|uniref:Putative RNA-directed DNA polymerase from transposon BS n=1 Tax=Trichonephila clavata TaxID=2740835 RepID=A0A8X6G6A8_TRICU|nr:putative RNA-directed DNA polymerase from transposon BS [Trichonephila clavata]
MTNRLMTPAVIDQSHLPASRANSWRGLSCVDFLLFLTKTLYFSQKVRDAHNLRPTNHTVAAFLDLSKVFDRVWKYKLVCKLYSTFKIRGRILSWLADFLRARCIRIKFKNTVSGKFRSSQGIPQGSVLSPILFSLFIAGIETDANSDHCMGLYADDIIIWSSSTSLISAQNKINSFLLQLENPFPQHSSKCRHSSLFGQDREREEKKKILRRRKKKERRKERSFGKKEEGGGGGGDAEANERDGTKGRDYSLALEIGGSAGVPEGEGRRLRSDGQPSRRHLRQNGSKNAADFRRFRDPIDSVTPLNHHSTITQKQNHFILRHIRCNRNKRKTQKETSEKKQNQICRLQALSKRNHATPVKQRPLRSELHPINCILRRATPLSLLEINEDEWRKYKAGVEEEKKRCSPSGKPSPVLKARIMKNE